MDYVEDIARGMSLAYFISETVNAHEAKNNGRGATLKEVVEGTIARADRVGIRFTNIEVTHKLDAIEAPQRNGSDKASGWRIYVNGGRYNLTERGREDFKTLPLQMSMQLASRNTLAKFLKTARNPSRYGT